MRPVFFRIWGALIHVGRTRRKKGIFSTALLKNTFLTTFLTSQSNYHTLDVDKLFLVAIQCLGHPDVHKWLVGKLSKGSKLLANSPTYKLTGST